MTSAAHCDLSESTKQVHNMGPLKRAIMFLIISSSQSVAAMRSSRLFSAVLRASKQSFISLELFANMLLYLTLGPSLTSLGHSRRCS